MRPVGRRQNCSARLAGLLLYRTTRVDTANAQRPLDKRRLDATQSATRQPVSWIRRQRPTTRIWAMSRISYPAIAIVNGLPDLCTIWRLSSGYMNHLWALPVDLAACWQESQIRMPSVIFPLVMESIIIRPSSALAVVIGPNGAGSEFQKREVPFRCTVE